MSRNSRRGSSLAVGYGEGAMYIGTDALALAPLTSRVSYLEDDDWVVLTSKDCTVYQGDRKVFETSPIEVTEAWTNRVKTVPVAFSLSLDKLSPGKYNCQITILNPTGQKAAFWQAPVVLVP